jgi:hypothetical protein
MTEEALDLSALMQTLEMEIRVVEGNGLSSVADAIMSIREILRILVKEKIGE